MNGARSTYMRKGYLLTALAAAVLLAASSGTALAQSIGFVGTSGTVEEAASGDAKTPPSMVTVRVSGVKVDMDGKRILTGLDSIEVTASADIRISPKDDGTGLVGKSSKLDFATENDAVLYVYPAAVDGDWKDEKGTLTLTGVGNAIAKSQPTFAITVVDDEVAPVATFSKASISLTEDSSTSVTVTVDPGTKMVAMQGVLANAPTLAVMVAPADAVSIGKCVDGKVLALTGGITATDAVKGLYSVKTESVKNSASQETGATGDSPIEIMACEDMSGFRDPMVTFSFVDLDTAADNGTLTDGGSLTVTVQSDEPDPTVGFVPTALTLAEGATGTVGIYADGKTGTEVGMVTVSMSGDAMVSLGGDAVTAMDDGSYQIDLGTSANVRFQVTSDSDRALEDGMTKTATLTITDASDADISAADGSLTVTVNGSTAVPALPLLGQLLLALFLMAGGARLYRRRQS